MRDLNLFKFTSKLQTRLEEISEQGKAEMITSSEESKLAGILEMDRIFILLNAKIIAQQNNRLKI